MPFDRFLISPLNAGLETDLRPWQILDDAAELLQNVYTFRGRWRKRDGSTLMGTTPQSSRLRVNLGNGAGVGITDGSGNAAGNVRTLLSDSTLPLAVGQTFTVGGAYYTVISSMAGPQPMLASQGSGTFNITNGDYTIVGAPATTQVYFYPGFPVMGITQYYAGVFTNGMSVGTTTTQTINNHPSYAFDTRYAYKYLPGSGWDRSGAAIWHGGDLNYFWASNWRGVPGDPILFVTNYNATFGTSKPLATDDPIWYLDNSTGSDVWTAMTAAANSPNGIYFLPEYGGPPIVPQAPYTGAFVQTARIIVPYHNMLVLLNTVENNNSAHNGTGTAVQYVNRARYSFVGNPFARNAWYEGDFQDSTAADAGTLDNIGAGGGFQDAPTKEAIISAEFIKDRLIVYLERSTWELAYTGNLIEPLQWNQLNTELGSMATFATAPFDTQILTAGQTGLHECNGSNVQRFDNERIPDQIFNFKTENNAQLRTHAIRDYVTELVYWAYVAINIPTTSTFPNKLLVYNYQNKSWAVHDDCFTAFGYYEQNSDTTWQSSAPATWENYNATWISNAFQANTRQIIGGTPEGFVLIINDEINRNAASMQITNISGATGIITLTIMSHNLSFEPTFEAENQDYILIENIIGDTTTKNALNGTIWQVYTVDDPNTIAIDIGSLVIGTYTGGGTAARVSNTQINTKQFNPYDKQDRNVYVHKVSFGIQKQGNFTLTPGPQITVDYATSSSSVSMIADATGTGAIMGTSVLEMNAYNPALYPLETTQERVWHPLYFQSDGECIQLRMYMTPEQMTNPTISLADLEIEGMILYTNPTTSRMQ